MYLGSYEIKSIKERLKEKNLKVKIINHKNCNYRASSNTDYFLFLFYDRVDRFIGEFKIAPFPGCCGTCVCFNFESYYNDYTKHLIKEVEKIARLELGFSNIIGTIVDDDMRDLLIKNKYGKKHEFLNKHTGNMVKFYSKNI